MQAELSQHLESLGDELDTVDGDGDVTERTERQVNHVVHSVCDVEMVP